MNITVVSNFLSCNWRERP